MLQANWNVRSLPSYSGSVQTLCVLPHTLDRLDGAAKFPFGTFSTRKAAGGGNGLNKSDHNSGEALQSEGGVFPFASCHSSHVKEHGYSTHSENSDILMTLFVISSKLYGKHQFWYKADVVVVVYAFTGELLPVFLPHYLEFERKIITPACLPLSIINLYLLCIWLCALWFWWDGIPQCGITTWVLGSSTLIWLHCLWLLVIFDYMFALEWMKFDTLQRSCYTYNIFLWSLQDFCLLLGFK